MGAFEHLEGGENRRDKHVWGCGQRESYLPPCDIPKGWFLDLCPEVRSRLHEQTDQSKMDFSHVPVCIIWNLQNMKSEFSTTSVIKKKSLSCDHDNKRRKASNQPPLSNHCVCRTALQSESLLHPTDHQDRKWDNWSGGTLLSRKIYIVHFKCSISLSHPHTHHLAKKRVPRYTQRTKWLLVNRWQRSLCWCT